MSWEAIDWTALRRLRSAYLAGSAGSQGCWHCESDLASYDATFAQRIGWKWDYVLAELTRRGWKPPFGEVMDWGCGSGIAGRAFLDHFGVQSAAGLRVWDRSPLAVKFAAGRARAKYPGLVVNDRLAGAQEMAPPISTLLLSHILNELTADQIEGLVELAKRAECVLWVEPGTHAVSRKLMAIRERLRDHLNVVAPCTHAAPCGMLVAGNERHWCHHFAVPPREIFTDRNWSRFAQVTGIDLRDLPLSFLVLDRRPRPSLPPGAGRVIGRPRIYKAHALLLVCDATGVRDRNLQQRTLPAEFRALKKSATDVLRLWGCDGDAIVSTQPLTK